MKKDPQIYLAHIRDAVQAIREYTEEGEGVFLKDRKTQDAVIRNLEIIGEAVKTCRRSLLKKYPDIPWKNIAGMRDRFLDICLNQLCLRLEYRRVGDKYDCIS